MRIPCFPYYTRELVTTNTARQIMVSTGQTGADPKCSPFVRSCLPSPRSTSFPVRAGPSPELINPLSCQKIHPTMTPALPTLIQATLPAAPGASRRELCLSLMRA